MGRGAKPDGRVVRSWSVPSTRRWIASYRSSTLGSHFFLSQGCRRRARTADTHADAYGRPLADQRPSNAVSPTMKLGSRRNWSTGTDIRCTAAICIQKRNTSQAVWAATHFVLPNADIVRECLLTVMGYVYRANAHLQIWFNLTAKPWVNGSGHSVFATAKTLHELPCRPTLWKLLRNHG